MPLGAQKAALLGAAGSAGGGFKAFGGLMIDWVSETSSPNPVPITGPMRAHIFYGTGKFYVTDGDKDVDWMVVAGGGASNCQGNSSPGGGAGGARASAWGASTSAPQINVSSAGGPSSDGVYPIVVGSGGQRPNYAQYVTDGTSPWNCGGGTEPAPWGALAKGLSSSALGISTTGGAPAPCYGGNAGTTGGSGSGGGNGNNPGGTGNQGGYSPAEGNNGGAASTPSGWGAPCGGGSGGGGGVGGAGSAGVGNGGNGGYYGTFFYDGRGNPSGGAPPTVAGGGGGGGGNNCGTSAGTNFGGGGDGIIGKPTSTYQNYNANRGHANTGGGAGGGMKGQPSYNNYNRGAAGGNGIVVIAYPR